MPRRVVQSPEETVSLQRYHHEGGVDGEDDGEDGDHDQYLWIGVDSA